MQQRDIIMDQIEQLGNVLAKIVADFLKLKSSGQFSIGMNTAQQQLKNELDINLDELLQLNEQELRNYLISRSFNSKSTELLSLYLEEIGLTELPNNETEALNYLAKTLSLIRTTNELSKTYSLELKNRENKLITILEKYH